MYPPLSPHLQRVLLMGPQPRRALGGPCHPDGENRRQREAEERLARVRKLLDIRAKTKHVALMERRLQAERNALDARKEHVGEEDVRLLTGFASPFPVKLPTPIAARSRAWQTLAVERVEDAPKIADGPREPHARRALGGPCHPDGENRRQREAEERLARVRRLLDIRAKTKHVALMERRLQAERNALDARKEHVGEEDVRLLTGFASPFPVKVPTPIAARSRAWQTLADERVEDAHKIADGPRVRVTQAPKVAVATRMTPNIERFCLDCQNWEVSANRVHPVRSAHDLKIVVTTPSRERKRTAKVHPLSAPPKTPSTPSTPRTPRTPRTPKTPLPFFPKDTIPCPRYLRLPCRSPSPR